MPLAKNWTKESILKLSMYRGLTYSVQKRIIETHDSIEHLFAEPPEWLQPKLNPNIILADNINIDRQLEENLELMEANSINFVCYQDDEYPQNLKLIEQSPTILYYKGSLDKQGADYISVVGTRKCSVYGRLTTERIVSELASQGIIIVSGLAYGIDAAAHQTTIKSGGRTYAVIASGIDEISPSTSEKLADEIIEHQGAIISEYRCGVKARPGYFPQRNRIISGISIATIVIESDVKGGSLITARFAADQSREVFAVPGPINSAKSAGCNKLIHDNLAIPALSAQSILSDLGLREEIRFSEEKRKPTFAKENDRLLYEALSHEPIQVDALSEATNIDISEILVKLLEFEFNGWVRQLPGKYYVIT